MYSILVVKSIKTTCFCNVDAWRVRLVFPKLSSANALFVFMRYSQSAAKVRDILTLLASTALYYN